MLSHSPVSPFLGLTGTTRNCFVVRKKSGDGRVQHSSLSYSVVCESRYDEKSPYSSFVILRSAFPLAHYHKSHFIVVGMQEYLVERLPCP
jgi:hypothetical protein